MVGGKVVVIKVNPLIEVVCVLAVLMDVNYAFFLSCRMHTNICTHTQKRTHVKKVNRFYQCQFPVVMLHYSSVAQSCPTLCDPMSHSMPGLPVHHQLLEFTQTYVHEVSDAIQPSHPLSSPSPPALNLSQNRGLFK